MKFSVHSGVFGERERDAARLFERMHDGERVAAPDLVLVDAVLEKLDAQGSALSGLVTRQSIFSGCGFAQADLSGADCEASVIVYTVFERATIAQASWYGCAFDNVSFRRCNLTRTEFDTVRFDKVSFAAADLTGASFAHADLRGVDFREAILDGTYFHDCLLDEEVAARRGVARKEPARETGPVREFADLFVHREERFSLGIEKSSATCFLSFPVRNPYVEYEEYYAITPGQLDLFRSSLASVMPFLTACRARRNDHLLIVQPGRERGYAT